jgi:hypothetical protein
MSGRRLRALCALWFVMIASASASEVRYVYLTAGKREGGQVVTYNKDGSIAIDFEFNDRGRGPRIHEAIKLDSTGIVAAYRSKGHGYSDASLDQRYRVTSNVAEWRDASERGRKRIDGTHIYVPLETSPAAFALLVRPAMLQPGTGIPVLPAGLVTAQRVTQVEVQAGAQRRSVALYSVTGLGLQSDYVWVDDQLRFFGEVSSGTALLPEGWESVEGRLLELQDRQANAVLEQLVASSTRRPSKPLAIRHVRVFDSIAGGSVGPATVYVFGDRITEIDLSNADPGEQAEIIEGEGQTLLPGLTDMHTHLNGWRAVLQIAGGVTTARDLANENDELQRLVERIDSGRAVGPRVHRAGLIDGKSPYSAPSGNNVQTLDEALQKVEWYARRGYQQIKLYNSIHPEWVAPIAAAAHARGMRVSGHVPAFMSAQQAVLAGYDEIHHLNMLFLNFVLRPGEDTRTLVRHTAVGERAGALDLSSAPVLELIGMLKARNTVIDPTVTIFESMFMGKAGERSPSYAMIDDHLPVALQRMHRGGSGPMHGREDAGRRAFAAMLRMIKQLDDAGVRLVAGTDQLEGFTLHRELELYVQAGLSAARALQIATIDAARILGVDQSLGSITRSKLADLVLVRGEPDKNISDVRRISLVIKGGVIYDPAVLYRACGIQPFTQ